MNKRNARNIGKMSKVSQRFLNDLVGKDLRPDQPFFIVICISQAAPDQDVRHKSAQGIRRLLAEARNHRKAVPARQFDAAVEEAVSHIRRRR